MPLELFEKAVDALKMWYLESNAKLHYPFIFRRTGASFALLAPHRGQRVFCWIGFLIYLRNDGTAVAGSFEMMREIQEVLVPFKGTPPKGFLLANITSHTSLLHIP